MFHVVTFSSVSIVGLGWLSCIYVSRWFHFEVSKFGFMLLRWSSVFLCIVVVMVVSVIRVMFVVIGGRIVLLRAMRGHVMWC